MTTYQVQWQDQFQSWQDIGERFIFRTRAAKYAAKKAIQPSYVNHWRVLSQKDGALYREVVLKITRVSPTMVNK